MSPVAIIITTEHNIARSAHRRRKTDEDLKTQALVFCKALASFML